MTSELDPRPGTTPGASAARGRFIVFEGNDGTGKSTQARLLAEHLEQRGREVLLTREPGGTEIGERLRGLVLEHGQGEIDARTEALIYAASRAAHAHQLIRPALERGSDVVCDRYIDSSAAYQGGGRGLGVAAITELSLWATEGLVPDLTIYLQLPGDEAAQRVRGRGAADRLESEPGSFHDVVRATFDELARDGSVPRRIVDGGGSVAEVAEHVRRTVAETFGEDGTDEDATDTAHEASGTTSGGRA